MPDHSPIKRSSTHHPASALSSRFRPTNKTTDPVLREHNPKIVSGSPYAFSSPDKEKDKGAYGLHVATPAKTRMGLFSSSSASGNDTPSMPTKIRSNLTVVSGNNTGGDGTRPSSRIGPLRPTTPHSALPGPRRTSISNNQQAAVQRSVGAQKLTSSIRMVPSAAGGSDADLYNHDNHHNNINSTSFAPIEASSPNSTGVASGPGTASPGALKRLWIQSGLGGGGSGVGTGGASGQTSCANSPLSVSHSRFAPDTRGEGRSDDGRGSMSSFRGARDGGIEVLDSPVPRMTTDHRVHPGAHYPVTPIGTHSTHPRSSMGDTGEVIRGGGGSGGGNYYDSSQQENEEAGGVELGMDFELVKGRAQGKGAKGEGVVVTIRIRPPTVQSGNAWITPSASAVASSSTGGQVIRLADGGPGAAGVGSGGGVGGGSAGSSGKEWWFDQVLPPNSTNKQTYASAARTHVHAAMLGFNSVVFAYGQTASGKTHTLTGTPDEPGVIPQSIDEIFTIIRNNPSREWLLRASYLELYNENLNDLLSSGTSAANEVTILNGKKDGEIQIQGLTEMVVTNRDDVRKVLRVGEGRRRTGCTDWNERSSRSHSVFRIVIESKERSGAHDDSGRATPGRSGNAQATRTSCLSLIDLAGSEKATASKERNVEGRHINQSLLTLKNVISKLTEQNGKKTAGHIPYRDSKLTRLLQPSLSGDAKISVICTINPSASSIAESQSTLAFASGIKKVILRAKQTEVVDPAALIQQYQNEIAELKAKLAEKDKADASGPIRMTLPEREERVHFNKRLAELKRLILTSNNVEEDSALSGGSPLVQSSGPIMIEHGRSHFSLQEELHIAQTKNRDQQIEIDRLKRDLSLRPIDPNQRILVLEEELARAMLMIKEYEQNLLDPGQKVREDVEAEYIPRISALEERAREKDQFYRDIYDSVHLLKTDNSKLRERCDRLEAEKGTFIEIVKELEMNGIAPSGSPSRDSGIALGMVFPASSATRVDERGQSDGEEFESGTRTLSRYSTNRMTSAGSISLDRMREKLIISGANKGMGLKTLREDSMFDLASRAAFVEREDEEDVF